MKLFPIPIKSRAIVKKPVIIPSGKHPFERRLIEKGVVDILNRLRKNGYEAYLVGGCIRDILLGMKPKDFDVVTSAHPRQIKRLFSRCFLIGKRFRLAHVYISQDRFVEVATFRAASSEIQLPDGRVIKNNNIYGTIEEDVLRRDFTVNSLYYNIGDSSIIDYTGGIKDIKKHILRTIGDPLTRFEEDPVRIIRAARFCARFDFKLATNNYKAAKEKAHLVIQSNASRLLDELLKILRCGACAKTMEYLETFGVLQHWIPELSPVKKNTVLLSRLSQLDAERNKGQDFTNSLLLAILFYDVFEKSISPDIKNPNDIFMASSEVFAPIATRMRIPKKDSDKICNIIARKIYFENSIKNYTPSFQRRFISNEHFEESLRFYSLLSLVESKFSTGVSFWKSVLEHYKNQGDKNITQCKDKPAPKKRKPKKKFRNVKATKSDK